MLLDEDEKIRWKNAFYFMNLLLTVAGYKDEIIRRKNAFIL